MPVRRIMRWSKPPVHRADVVELVDTLALGASAARREGSSPFIRTKVNSPGAFLGYLLFYRRSMLQ